MREWDATFRLLRQHGMSVPDTVRHGASQVIFETYPSVGYNYRMTDIQAAVGREQLKRLPEIVAARRALAERYRQLLAAVSRRCSCRASRWARSNWQSFCVRLPDGCDQRAVMQAMLDAGVATRRGIMCSHREPAYRDLPLRAISARSEFAQDRSIILPLYPQMTATEQDLVQAALAQACLRMSRRRAPKAHSSRDATRSPSDNEEVRPGLSIPNRQTSPDKP